MTKTIFTFIIACSILPLYSQNPQKENLVFPVLSGPYMGQKAPGIIPELFAPEIISDGMPNRDIAISPSGDEIYFSVSTPNFQFSTIVFTKQINGIWTKPEVTTFAADPRYKYIEPAFSCDGKKLFFASNMPKDGTVNPGDYDIWVVDRLNDGWGKPYNLGEPVNTPGGEYFPSLTKNGTLYFTRNEQGESISYIYRSGFVNEKYSLPEKLPEQINCGEDRYNAYISSDESFMVVPAQGVEKGAEGAFYYIVFKKEDGTWHNPLNMGPSINSKPSKGWSLSISPDGKYIFFMASKKSTNMILPETLSMDFLRETHLKPENGNSDIYWVDAKIIETMRANIQGL